MAIMAKDTGGGDFELLPAGMHHGVNYAVIDIGTQPQHDPKYPKRRKVIFIWELPKERITITKDGVEKNLPRAISREFTLSLSKKSNLRPALESWRGRGFTEAELDGWDVSKVAGANCLLNVVHEKNTKGDKTYANVAGINPLMKDMVKLKPENPIVTFALDEFLKSKLQTIPLAIPEWIATRIMQSDEWLAHQGGAQPSHTEADRSAPASEDEDVPF